MFGLRLGPGVPRALFDVGDRDLALAFAELEGYAVMDESGNTGTVLPCGFTPSSTMWRESRKGGIRPEQVAPGVFSYRLKRRPAVRVYGTGLRFSAQ